MSHSWVNGKEVPGLKNMEMKRKSVTKSEMDLKIAVCVSTLFNLNGYLPDMEELSEALGAEYSVGLGDWMSRHGAQFRMIAWKQRDTQVMQQFQYG